MIPFEVKEKMVALKKAVITCGANGKIALVEMGVILFVAKGKWQWLNGGIISCGGC